MIFSAWVPLPTPGGPSTTRCQGRGGTGPVFAQFASGPCSQANGYQWSTYLATVVAFADAGERYAVAIPAG